MLSTPTSIRGLMTLYQRKMHQINHREPLKLPVRHMGCVKDANGVKYFSMAARCFDGAAWHSVRMT